MVNKKKTECMHVHIRDVREHIGVFVQTFSCSGSHTNGLSYITYSYTHSHVQQDRLLAVATCSTKTEDT